MTIDENSTRTLTVPPRARRTPAPPSKKKPLISYGHWWWALPAVILVIDNYDSFVFNIARYVQELGHETKVLRNDYIDIFGIAASGAVYEPTPSGMMIEPVWSCVLFMPISLRHRTP